MDEGGRYWGGARAGRLVAEGNIPSFGDRLRHTLRGPFTFT
jgi:hypothetical protein